MGRAIDVSLNYGGHIQRAYGYSGSVESETVLASSGATTTLAYEYDTLGQMSPTTQTGTLGARRDEYDYSLEGWLLQEDQDLDVDRESTTFSYDPAGNRLTPERSAVTAADFHTVTNVLVLPH